MAIVCDDYKLEYYKARLTKEKLEFKTVPGPTPNVTTIMVYTMNFILMKTICEQLEAYFKNAYKQIRPSSN